ncbi:Uncharacterized protein BP5553_07064 [Venustampulla echinocandica]|uniref:FAD-binding domain-containing protein n=1 Tax=Venustampulla echinocandica TaxID=2656787 RepID=A0A370TIE8_9HELO|nr:Uncharacterized protein BP5553_07064 [Venustampulla echinocandica]RDL35133.1 Uncharacterized protein BP5553_07064 [Venustampulla echinocandica]
MFGNSRIRREGQGVHNRDPVADLLRKLKASKTLQHITNITNTSKIMAPSLEDTSVSNGVDSYAKSPATRVVIPTPIHPTRSLQFLEKLNGEGNNTTHHPLQAKVKLRVGIVGAGLGGLSCAIALARRGHEVVVFEQATKLGEVGAGIQIPSNSARLLQSWGLEPFLGPHVVEPDGMTFRRWENGDPIGYTKLVPDFRENFKAPYYVVHRAHFHTALYERALELGVTVKVASRVEEYDTAAPSLKLANGEEFNADLIVAADGVKSAARKLVLGGKDAPVRSTGFAAYRATVDVEKMKADPELSWLLEKPSLNIWIGEDRHVMTYTIAAGKSFNMVLSHVDATDPLTWKPETAIPDMRREFSGWDSRLVKIINMIEKTIKWPLLSGPALKTWIAPGKKVLIMGDAAHAMVPYMSQGAAMAVEDGGALATVLSLIDDASEIPAALESFEKERIKRGGAMQQASLLNGKLWHFADGPEQRLRDESMRPEVEGRSFSWSANQWSDPVTQWWAYGYDAEEEMEIAWARDQESTKSY